LVSKPQALRYRRGKLPNGAPIPDSDESSSEEEVDDEQPRGRNEAKRRGRGREGDTALVAGGAGRVIPQTQGKVVSRNIQVALRDVEVQDDGAVLIGGKREISGIEEDEGECSAVFLAVLSVTFNFGPL
jgi:hypothetical protein